MITINLKPEIEAQLREKANLQNLTLEQYIETLIEKEITTQTNDYPLKGSVIYYQEPFEPATPIEDWDVLT